MNPLTPTQLFTLRWITAGQQTGHRAETIKALLRRRLIVQHRDPHISGDKLGYIFRYVPAATGEEL